MPNPFGARDPKSERAAAFDAELAELQALDAANLAELVAATDPARQKAELVAWVADLDRIEAAQRADEDARPPSDW